MSTQAINTTINVADMTIDQLRELRRNVDGAITAWVKKQNGPRAGTFRVEGSYGTLECCVETGAVLRYRPDANRGTWLTPVQMAARVNDEGYFDITRLDVVEWKRAYPDDDIAAGHHILDFGHWSSKYAYVPADEDFREEVKRQAEPAR
jgi:hypothetical protein